MSRIALVDAIWGVEDYGSGFPINGRIVFFKPWEAEYYIVGYIRDVEGDGFLVIIEFENDWGILDKVFLVGLLSIGEAQNHGLRFIFKRNDIGLDIWFVYETTLGSAIY